MTFIGNSATWLRDRLARQCVLGVAADTFHAAVLRIARRVAGPPRAAVKEINPDAGETLAAITESEFGVAFMRPGRFAESGWSVQGVAPLRCADCGSKLTVCRKPFVRYGQVMRCVALLCPRCRPVVEPKELPDADRKALRRWSSSR